MSPGIARPGHAPCGQIKPTGFSRSKPDLSHYSLSFPDNPLLFTNFSGLFSVAFFDCTMGPKFSLFAGKMASF